MTIRMCIAAPNGKGKCHRCGESIPGNGSPPRILHWSLRHPGRQHCAACCPHCMKTPALSTAPVYTVAPTGKSTLISAPPGSQFRDAGFGPRPGDPFYRDARRETASRDSGFVPFRNWFGGGRGRGHVSACIIGNDGSIGNLAAPSYEPQEFTPGEK